MSFFVLSSQSVNFNSNCFIGGFLWLYVVISLILLSSLFFEGFDNSSCVFGQALLRAASKILSGYPLFNKDVIMLVASSLKSTSFLHILLALMSNPYGTASF